MKNLAKLIFGSFLSLVLVAGVEAQNLNAPPLNDFFKEDGELYKVLEKEGEGTGRILKDYTTSVSDEDKLLDGGREVQTGATVVRSIIKRVIDIIKLILIPIAILLIMWGGLMLMFKRKDEEEYKKRVRQLIWTGVGFLLIFLSVTLVDGILFGRTGGITSSTDAIDNAAKIAGIELFGLYKFIISFAVVIAVAYVVYTGFKLIITSESEEARGNAVKSLLYIVLGVAVLMLAPVIVKALFGLDINEGGKVLPSFGSDNSFSLESQVGGIIGLIIQGINYLLGFVGILALLAIVYAGTLMILGFGDDERVSKGKSIIIYAILAMILASSIWIIVKFLIFAFI